MSTKLLTLSDRIRASTLSYLRTAYDTNRSAFNNVRDRYIQANEGVNRLFSDDLFELIPRYQTADRLLCDYLPEIFGAQGNPSHDEVSQFGSAIRMLVDEINYEPYLHQIEALRESILKGKNVVVTTGTGSGKTLCFLIPVITNLLIESIGSGDRRRWTSMGASTDWWQSGSQPYSYNRGSQRTAAVRCMIVYPLNALVRDQIETMRSILDSSSAQAFYRDSLEGDRIYFGQYVGATRGRGSPKDQRKLSQAREYMQTSYQDYMRAERLRTAGKDKDLWRHIENPAGSQMLLRWDMQSAWPDILITNFTMLSIMMVRDRERSLFESTRKWLDESDENVFYLVLDELHSYRGTPGTEISYTVKLFMDALSLYPGHPQLRIIATSASLEDQTTGKEDPQFIRDFFGDGNEGPCFTVIEGKRCLADRALLPLDKQKRWAKRFLTTLLGKYPWKPLRKPSARWNRLPARARTDHS